MMHPPVFGDGQRVGLFGGSFNPAHSGHYRVALYALKALQLDWVWWLLSPQNPLKNPGDTADYATRLAQTRTVARHPRFIVSDLEQQIGSRNTAETLHHLAVLQKRAHFVWIMGSDSFANLQHWHDWTDIVLSLPLAVVARPGSLIRALNSPAATRFHAARIPTQEAAKVVTQPPPAWVFLPLLLRPESSSAIRRLNQSP